uniref:Uncharacterized protein n=1 Tax=Seriola dumerili TaxID=41447 RepID=A0A3B4UIS6_SERDU
MGTKKLGSIGVWSGVGHGQDARAGVLQGEVLVSKLVAIDGLSTGSIVVGEVPTLRVEQHTLTSHALTRVGLIKCVFGLDDVL